MTTFPTSLDSLTNPTALDNLDTVGVVHHVQHSDANDAIEALETKVGVDNSAVTTSLDYKVANKINSDGTNSAIDELTFDTTPASSDALNAGQMRWNATDETMDMQLNSQVNMQVGQEQFIRVVNKTAAIITDGQVVRVSGAQGNRPTAVLAQADTFNSSVVIGVATQNIAINGEGFVTTHGVVNGFDTSVFSGAGAYLYLSSTTPGVLVDQITTPVPAMVTPVAVALNQTNNGAIFVSPFYPRSTDGTLAGNSNSYSPSEKAIKTYADVGLAKKKYYHGVFSRATISPLPTNLTTTTFTLAANTTNIIYYYLGTPITVSTAKTATLDDGLGGSTAGIYYVYFNGATGNILATKAFPGISNTSNVIIAEVFWNGVDYGVVTDNRHGYDRDHAWHERAHDTIGPRYQSGLAFSWTGNVVANTTFAIGTGAIHDEDIDFTVAATQCRLWYQTSATTYGFTTALSNVPYLNNGTNIQSVNPTGYTLSTITSSNRYFNYFVYATTDCSGVVQVVAETTATVGGYTSVGAARAVTPPNITGIMGAEWKLIYRLVVNGPGLIQTPVAADDYRTTSTISGGATATVNATGVQENNFGNVQTAINTILAQTAGYSTTATAAGTTTLDSASTHQQFFTGTTTQTVVMPVVSTLTLGTNYTIVNQSTGAVTVQSSGANDILVLAGGTQADFTSIAITGTDASVWHYIYEGEIVASGKRVVVNNSITLTGTDGTTYNLDATGGASDNSIAYIAM